MLRVPGALVVAEQADVARKITSLVPGYISMGDGAMDDMPMNVPLPENTLPMMTGSGPYGGIEMGGMFTVMKIRADLRSAGLRA